MSNAGCPSLAVPPEVVKIAKDSIGAFFEPISRVPREQSVADFLDLSKANKRLDILQQYTQTQGRRVLEVGSGFGTNLAVWIKCFEVDAYGTEPGGEGFDQGYRASRILLEANGIDPERIFNAPGESLPFPDESFDIVYSANVLEHTLDPERVLAESVRVLRRGGVLHMEMPNYLSYFEGHYMVLQPPIVFRALLPLWVRIVFRRDPEFARSLRTEINPVWCRRVIRRLGKKQPLTLVSLGEELFLARLSHAFSFETQVVASRLSGPIAWMKKFNRGNWIGRLIVALQGHYPIYLTAIRN
jgi:SAM-dependent methyltransferase